MAQIAARPATFKLTDNSQQSVVPAPGAGKRIIVYSIECSQDSNAISTLDIKEGNTVEHTFVLAANGGRGGTTFPNGWGLPENVALNAQQSGAGNCPVNITHRIVPA